MPVRSPEQVGRAAQIACLLEVSAHKPGNVSRFVDFQDTRFEDFLLSAAALGPVMATAQARSVGETIFRAVQETRQLVAANTNLGVILLFSPLARACGPGPLRNRLHAVLASLSVADARWAYKAIRLARPGGLGRVRRHDVRGPVKVTLLEAMTGASHRDTIAREYATDFNTTFEISVPALLEWRERAPLREAVVQTFLTILSRVPDTLIARKNGPTAAEAVSRAAAETLRAGGATTPQGRRRLGRLDAWLRSRGNRLNPGTTADLTAAALFVAILQRGFSVVHEGARSGTWRARRGAGR